MQKRIIWFMTSRCDRNCPYCLRKIIKGGSKNTSRIVELINLLNYPVTLTGGEPLLLPYLSDVIFALKGREITLETNLLGTLPSEGAISLLSKIDFNLGSWFYNDDSNIDNLNFALEHTKVDATVVPIRGRVKELMRFCNRYKRYFPKIYALFPVGNDEFYPTEYEERLLRGDSKFSLRIPQKGVGDNIFIMPDGEIYKQDDIEGHIFGGDQHCNTELELLT